MPDHKTKHFTFWRARFTQEPYNRTMQQLLKSAFENTKIQDRLWPPHEGDDEVNYFYFINHKIMDRGYFCANFFGYERGRVGQIIKEKFDSDQIDLTALPLSKADDGTDQQFLDGKLYFVCFENNLILAQDMHLKARHLEHYVNHMFYNRCESFPNKQCVLLERSLSQAARDQITGVKRINLSAPLTYSSMESVREQWGRKAIPSGRTWGAVKSFVSDKLDLTQFETDGFIDPKDIDVTMSLSWNRKRGERVSNQMDSLANAFSHIDDETDIELETHSGKMKYNKLRLNRPQSVIHRDDMPDNYDIFNKMIAWYEHLVETGDI